MIYKKKSIKKLRAPVFNSSVARRCLLGINSEREDRFQMGLVHAWKRSSRIRRRELSNRHPSRKIRILETNVSVPSVVFKKIKSTRYTSSRYFRRKNFYKIRIRRRVFHPRIEFAARIRPAPTSLQLL